MQKLTRALAKGSGDAPQVLGALDRASRLVHHYLRLPGVSPRVLSTVLGLMGITLLGFANLHAAPYWNFEFVYLLVSAVTGWLAGGFAGLTCCVLSLVFLWRVETTNVPAFAQDWFYWCNSGIRAVGFMLVSWLVGEIGTSSRKHALALEERTSTLKTALEEQQQTADWLQEAMHLLQEVGENVRSVLWVSDASRTQYEFVNAAFEKVWGEARETLYHTPATWLLRVHPDDRDRVIRAMRDKQPRGEYDEQYRVLSADGTLRWVHDRAFPIKNEVGAVYRVLGLTEDITERKRTEQMLQAERDVGMALGSGVTLNKAVTRLLEIATHLEGVDCGGVYLSDLKTGDLRLEAHTGLSSDCVERVAHYLSESAEAKFARAGRVLFMDEQQIPRNYTTFWGNEGMRSLALVPLQHKGTLLGMLNVGSYRFTKLEPGTRVGIELIASQLSGAIARMQAEESLRRSEAHLRSIVNHAPMALLAADSEGVVTFEDGRALASMGLERGKNLGRPLSELFCQHPQAIEMTNRALAGETCGALLEMQDTVLDCRCSPLRNEQGRCSGIVLVASDVTDRFRLQREVLEITDREQARIGQDLHDGLCQQLIGMAFKAQNLERALKSEERDEAETAGRLAELLDEAITESRRVCRGLYPVRLSTDGLLPALEELAKNCRERYQVQCGCECHVENLNYGLGTATHIYRIAQEAVSNAIKHSQARTIRIDLTETPQGALLRVCDDGKGFEYPLSKGGGMGLHIMSYRASLIGAELQIRPGDRGTEVSCLVPHSSTITEGRS